MNAVSDYTDTHCRSQCSNFDDHLDMMSSVYKEGQHETFTEAVSKYITNSEIKLNNMSVSSPSIIFMVIDF